MESNITKEITKEQVNLFLEESKPFFECLIKMKELKPKKWLFNTETFEAIDLNNDDTEEELNIKNHIESIKKRIFES